MTDNLSILKQKIDFALKQNSPFTCYRKPFFDAVTFISQNSDTINYLDNYSQKGFVFAPFDTTKKTLLFSLDQCEISSFSIKDIEFKIQPLNFETKFNLEISGQNFHKEKHIALVKKGIEFIKRSPTKKIVLSRKEIFEMSSFNAIKTFFNLLQNYKNAFVYIWYHPKIGLWLGATPETLVQIKNNNFKTMSLAGTQEYKNTLDVTWHEKEIEEQKYVTDYILNQLQNSNINCKSNNATTIKAGNLLHLCSDISGRISSKQSLGLIIKTLHPTPAVCGLPKEDAKQFILENENYKREFYTGFLGELNFEESRKSNRKNIENSAYKLHQKTSNLFVNLRCMQVVKSEINLYIGGGITAESNPEKEYIETVIKSKTIKKCL